MDKKSSSKFFRRTVCVALVILLFVACCIAAGKKRTAAAASLDYTSADNWAYQEAAGDKPADLFIICPTVAAGSEEQWNMDTADEKSRDSFTGALNMELGIYTDECRVYAPYYRQATLYTYGAGGDTLDTALNDAYVDVRAAFTQYLNTADASRPLVLAGFSQGADLMIRLVEDFFQDKTLQQRLVAGYAIGWRLTEEECAKYPHLRPAGGEDDLGVIVCFNSEAESVTDSLLVPAGTKTLAINPLNWKTDSTPADASLNLGACFTQYSGEIKQEIPMLCGCYIDPVRGTLKVTGVTPAEYPPVLPIFADGIYHLYDYQFFYRNLQKNVSVRVAAYQNAA